MIEFSDERLSYVRVGGCAHKISEHASVAYWNFDAGVSFHQKAVQEELEKIADLLGFELVEKTNHLEECDRCGASDETGHQGMCLTCSEDMGVSQ